MTARSTVPASSVWSMTLSISTRRSLVASLICVTVAAGTEARQPSAAVGPTRVTVRQAEKAIDQAAAARKIPLSETAKTALAVEVVRQDAMKPATADSTATTDVKIQEVLTSVAARPTTGEVSAREANVLVSNSKAQQIVPALDQAVAAQAANAGKRLTDDTRALIVADLETQTRALAGSGLSVETIKQRNEAYLAALNTLLPERSTVTPVMYQKVRRALFTHFVSLTITTVPPGATVTMEGDNIGTTNNVTRTVEPGKLYRFEFTLAGYHSPALDFYVTPAPDVQNISEPLTPDDLATVNTVRPPGPSSAPPGASNRGFPFISVGVAVAGLLVGLILLIRMKS